MTRKAPLIAAVLLLATCLSRCSPVPVQAQDTPPSAPVETTSIGVVVPVFICAVPPPRRVRRTDPLGAHAFPADRFEWVRIIAPNRSDCAVRVQLTDLVTDQRKQCFSWEEWQDPDFGVGWMVIPVATDQERSIEYSPDRWIRMAHVRGSRRRAVRH